MIGWIGHDGMVYSSHLGFLSLKHSRRIHSCTHCIKRKKGEQKARLEGQKRLFKKQGSFLFE
jgi:hypothetical protein